MVVLRVVVEDCLPGERPDVATVDPTFWSRAGVAVRVAVAWVAVD